MLKEPMHVNIDVAGVLRKHGYRATSGRIAILNALIEAKKPLSSHEIYERCKVASLDAVTVYRALEAFVESRLVQRVDLQHGHVDYEFIFNDHHHHHIVCKKCGTVEDFISANCKQLAERARRSSGKFKVIEDHSMELFGLCTQCA